jgi:hypothetical protein
MSPRVKMVAEIMKPKKGSLIAEFPFKDWQPVQQHLTATQVIGGEDGIGLCKDAARIVRTALEDTRPVVLSACYAVLQGLGLTYLAFDVSDEIAKRESKLTKVETDE